MDGITAGFLKLRELVGEARAFRLEDQYTLVGIREMGCKEKSKIVDLVLDEVYKYGDEFNLTILLLGSEGLERLKQSLGEDITQELEEKLEKS
ncbi:hypothetical protein L3N51_02102 [Metallosphaera sp. J1]|uniref:hypothetical protein n=1 Tax=Metallosphaera TaxID=41980 RepID=UPI001EDE7CCD|nr:hypothetical protein [Metallosphaera javensis (ex Hofmann et al. 2022)]MCG3109806.1 hypothetical protein [Metallosphaera javensis (ex Hofmann et al. 2022)]BCS92697.1 MAG: hypothetical protein MjAS7_1305 [Metallosphaera javensis (ex Sakai et al. 2022)]